MAKFRKKIVKPGAHTVGRLDGTEEKDAITPSRIKAWVDNTKKLQASGYLIPAPLAHQDKEKRLALPVIKAKDGETLADAYSGESPGIPPAWDLANLNAGYWEDFDVDPVDGSLVGVVNAENEDKAKLLGKDVKQTSVLVMPGRTIKDPDGNSVTVGEHLAHVACCIHAQEPGQQNFEPLSPVPEGMAMSFILAMDDITGLPDPNKPKDQKLYQVVTLLRSSLNVALPEDVTRENFLDSLILVLTQKLADQQESEKEESVSERPSEAVTKTPSIAMSQTTQKQEPKVVSETDKQVALLMSIVVGDKKEKLKKRVDNLISTGRVGKDWADKNLYPKVEAFTMSAADLKEGQAAPKGLLEELIEGLEQAQPLTGPSLSDDANVMNDVPLGAEREELPADIVTGAFQADLKAETMDSLLDDAGI